jgi:hypothetical protein
MNADEFLGTRRVGRATVVLFLSFRWTEGEPAHVDSYSAGTKSLRRSQTEWGVVVVLPVALDDDNQQGRT